MKTVFGDNTGLTLEPILWNARKSVWIISPYISRNYSEQLVSLSQRGIEVRIITSNEHMNKESIEVLKDSENQNLILLILDKQKAGFIHSKTYIVDHEKAFCGSANLTYNGLNSNYESLTVAENLDEFQQIEHGFMKTWMDFERKGMSKEEFRFEKAKQIKNALPLLIDYGEIDYPNIKGKELVYYPYYYFEYSFKTSVGKSPSKIFQDSGSVLVDAVTRQIIDDDLLIDEIENNPASDYGLRTKDKYKLKIREARIRNYYEAKELAIDYIREQNTRTYQQHYTNRSYTYTFIPYPSIIRFIRSDFVQVPLWHIERHEEDGRKHVDIILGASRKKWTELLICPECETKISIDKAVKCQSCGTEVCQSCIQKVGLILKKKLCPSCYPQF